MTTPAKPDSTKLMQAVENPAETPTPDQIQYALHMIHANFRLGMEFDSQDLDDVMLIVDALAAERKRADIAVGALHAGRMDSDRLDAIEGLFAEADARKWDAFMTDAHMRGFRYAADNEIRLKQGAVLAARNQSADGAEGDDLGRAIHDLGEITPEENNP